MSDEFQSKFLAKHEVDKDVLELARERTEHAFRRFDHIAVSFSGGKDSTAVLNIALEVAERLDRLPLRAIFWDEEAIPYETEHYVRRVASDPRIELEWYCIPILHRNACSTEQPFWWPWAPEVREKWVRPLPAEAITHLEGFPMEPPAARLSIPDCRGLTFPPHLGECGELMGIRADESLIRFRAVTRRHHENYIIQGTEASTAGNVWKVYPIYDWQATDVWTAPAQLGWDYNQAYDLMEMAGVNHDAQRCSPAFGEEPLSRLWTYATCFPDVWDRMVDRVPGACAAARYARSELYSYRARAEPPPGMSWEEFLRHTIESHAPELRGRVAKQVRKWIHHHHKRTGEPIMVDAQHPDTGVSWKQLHLIAVRGDLKNRRSFDPGRDPVKLARMRAAYDAERKARAETATAGQA